MTTRAGDGGKSQNYDGDYFGKDDLLFEALGTFDELSSWLGRIRHLLGEGHGPGILRLQEFLKVGGSLAATEPGSPRYPGLVKVSADDTAEVEGWMEGILEAGLVLEPGFVVPGQTAVSADVDIARTVCRRAKRSLVRYMNFREGARSDLRNLSVLLNRTSDYLFLLGRFAEQKKL